MFLRKRTQRSSSKAIVLVDGYNVIKHREYPSAGSLEHDREQLVALLAAWRTSWPIREIHVIFDSRQNTFAPESSRKGRIRVVFAAGSADDYLQAYIRQAKTSQPITLISDDASIKWTARDCGATHISVPSFLAAVLMPKKTSPAHSGKKDRMPADKALSPADRNAITKELRSIWNI